MRCFKSLIVCISLILLCLSLVGCGFLFETLTKADFELLYEPSEIKAIEIVTVGAVKRIEDASSIPSVVYEPNFDVICEVQDAGQFMADFSKVDCFRRISDPSRPHEGDIGIKIIYNNGDYDIICDLGQGECKNGIYDFEKGYHSFDLTQFDELVNKYINKGN